MDLTFSTSYDNFGYEQIVELVPGGQVIPVTNENKGEFVEKYIDWYVNSSVEAQFRPFYKGFYKVISTDSINVNDQTNLVTQQRRGYQADSRRR